MALATLGAWAQNGTYRLQPEDIIRIAVYNEQQVQAIVPVGKDGNISAPFLGIIRAAGKTTSELEADLAAEYVRRLRLRDPKVSVTIERFRVIRASVGGFVNRPGVFEVRPTDTILTLLNNGGGPVQDGRADLRRATLVRGGSREMIPIDLFAMLIKGDTSQNYVLQDGDQLTVPEETRNRILVLGAVLQPGTYPFKEPMSVMDAISMARGEIRYRSKFSAITIIRERPGMPGQYMRIPVNLVAFLARGDAAQNVALQPGDVVFVPETRTPDMQQISAVASSIANSLFILDRFGIDILGLGR
jgi:polysaccharide export outer membrane protein